jgi:hypothetical protein
MKSNQKPDELLIKLDMQLPHRVKDLKGDNLDKIFDCPLFAKPSFLTGKHTST